MNLVDRSPFLSSDGNDKTVRSDNVIVAFVFLSLRTQYYYYNRTIVPKIK